MLMGCHTACALCGCGMQHAVVPSPTVYGGDGQQHGTTTDAAWSITARVDLDSISGCPHGTPGIGTPVLLMIALSVPYPVVP